MAESGQVTVVMVAVIGVTVLLLVGGAYLASAVTAMHRARAAADLAALAAAQSYQQGADWGASCAAGAAIATRNAAGQLACAVGSDGSVTVVTTAPVTWSLPGPVPQRARATARAGPVTG